MGAGELESMRAKEASPTRLKTSRKKPRTAILPRVSLGAVVRENLPLPVAYYPNHYGTFLGFAQNEGASVVICACAKPAIENLYRPIPNHCDIAMKCTAHALFSFTSGTPIRHACAWECCRGVASICLTYAHPSINQK